MKVRHEEEKKKKKKKKDFYYSRKNIFSNHSSLAVLVRI